MVPNAPLPPLTSKPKTQFCCCFPPLRALQSCQKQGGLEVKLSIPESDIVAGVRLYLMRDKAVEVKASAVDQERAVEDSSELEPQAEFLAVVSLIHAPGSRDGLEVKLWVPETEMPDALPLHHMRGQALWVSIEVLEDEFLFADAKTKKQAQRAQAQTLAENGGNVENQASLKPEAPSTPKRLARRGRVERGYSGL